MSDPSQPSDALVFFGATGDLAYKKIFPALQALFRDYKMELPIIGVARGSGGIDSLRGRMRDGPDERLFRPQLPPGARGGP